MTLNVGTYALARYCFMPQSFYLSLCMPLPTVEYDAEYGRDTLIRFGAIDPDDTLEMEAA